MKIKKTTPILCVDSIERCLPFWLESMGYVKTVEVPHEGVLGFVILKNDGSEIMLQTHRSLKDDLPEVAKHIKPGAIFLYSDVNSIQETRDAMKNAKVIVPLRTTEYGANEIFIQDHDGNVIGFAEFNK